MKIKKNCSLFLLVFVCTLSVVTKDVFAARNSYFVMSETKSRNLKPFPKWTGVMDRFGKQTEIPDSQCGKKQYHPCVVKDWRKLIESVRNQPLRKQLKAINNWANKHPYIIDQLNWGLEDYWETPYEFMTVNGDCEDYAIAKYYSLRALGVPEEDLRIIIVQDFNLGGIIHAILGVYDDGELLILDNQIKQIRPAMSIYHYRPIYGVNKDWWWAYTPRI
ncbi:MAG: transglutaminase-like cysteine peptidase [Rickettsiales bacterium]